MKKTYKTSSVLGHYIVCSWGGEIQRLPHSFHKHTMRRYSYAWYNTWEISLRTANREQDRCRTVKQLQLSDDNTSYWTSKFRLSHRYWWYNYRNISHRRGKLNRGTRLAGQENLVRGSQYSDCQTRKTTQNVHYTLKRFILATTKKSNKWMQITQAVQKPKDDTVTKHRCRLSQYLVCSTLSQWTSSDHFFKHSSKTKPSWS